MTGSTTNLPRPYDEHPFQALSRLTVYLVYVFLLFLLLISCRSAEPPPTATPPVTPTIILIPPIEPGDGSDVMDKLLERGILRVGIRVWPSAEYSPPAFRGAANAITGGALTGFEVDIAHLIAEGLGLELELVEAYPPVIINGDWRGNWDIALAMLAPFDQPPEPSLVPLTYSQPYGYMPLGVLQPAGAGALETIDQLAGRAVGVLEHSASERLLTANRPLTVQNEPLLPELPAHLQVRPISNLAKEIQQFAIEPDSVEFEAIFGPAPILQQALVEGLPLQLTIPDENLGRQPLAVAAVPQENLKVERLIAEINNILERANRQGILAEIYLDWYGQDFSQPESR